MSQTEPETTEEPVIVPGTEGTEYEGLSEEEIERAEFDKAVEEDPDMSAAPTAADESAPVDKDDPPPDPDLSAEPEPEPEKVVVEKKDPEPTGLEWLSTLSDEDKKTAQNFIDRQGQTIARLDQRVSSHLGQLQPAQRGITKLQIENRELRGQLSKAQTSSYKSIADRITDYNTQIDEEYKDFPEEATKLKTQYSESLDGLSEALPTATPTETTLPDGPDRNDEVLHLATAYSDWGERRFSPEFNQWIGLQNDEMKSLINSGYASDSIALLDAFGRDNPEWIAPQNPEDFHSLQQASYSPLYRGWAAGEGINPDMDLSKVPDYQRDSFLTRFKSDLGVVRLEHEQANNPPTDNPPAEPSKVTKLKQRRREQLADRNPGSRRLGVMPGEKLDLDTEEGQRALFKQLVDTDPDLN